jgi:hypothetical protein
MSHNEFLEEIVSDTDLSWEVSEIEAAIRNIESAEYISDVVVNLNDILVQVERIKAEAKRLLRRIDNEATED